MVWVQATLALPPDTLIGVFCAFTLGLGICLLVAVTQRFNIHQIEAVMFGSLLTVTDARPAAAARCSAPRSALVLARYYNALLLDSLEPAARARRRRPTARSTTSSSSLLTAAIVVSLKVIGALLVEAMVVVPAAAARNLARTTRGYLAGASRSRWSPASAGSSSRAACWYRSAARSCWRYALFFVTLAIAGVRSMWRG